MEQDKVHKKNDETNLDSSEEERMEEEDSVNVIINLKNCSTKQKVSTNSDNSSASSSKRNAEKLEDLSTKSKVSPTPTVTTSILVGPAKTKNKKPNYYNPTMEEISSG